MDHLIYLFHLHRYRRLGCCLLLFFQTACSSQPQNTLTPEKDQLTFGRGGGISGEVQSHILLNSGQLYATSSLFTDTVHLTDLAPDTVRTFFARVDSLPSELDFQHPGNRYYFIRHQQQEVTWGDPDHPPPLAVQQLYNALQHIVPKQP